MPDASLKKKRPLWYNLSPLNLPLPGLVSILHRISGAALFLLLLWLLYLLDQSLASSERSRRSARRSRSRSQSWSLLGLLWSFLHHLSPASVTCSSISTRAIDLASRARDERGACSS